MHSLSKGCRAGGRVYSFTAITQGGGMVTCTLCSTVLCAVVHYYICTDVTLALAYQLDKTVSYLTVCFIYFIACHLCESLNSSI